MTNQYMQALTSYRSPPKTNSNSKSTKLQNKKTAENLKHLSTLKKGPVDGGTLLMKQ